MKRFSLLIKKKYRLLLRYSQEILLFFNHSGKIIDCNQAAKDKLGYGNEIFQLSIIDVFQKAVKDIDGRLLIGTRYQDKNTETVAYRKNQTCFAVELKIVLVTGSRKLHGVCTAVDISDKKNLIHDYRHIKNELKSSRKIKNEFIANITHELKTPVNGIMGLTENLLETELTPKQLETLNIINRCCSNMNKLINDLLDFTKIGSHKMVLEKRVFSIHKMIDDVITFNINKINEKGLKLIINAAKDIPNRVIGDECRLTQILNNLFSNAIKFTSVGQIALEIVKTAETENEVELFFMVMDTGIGISLEEKDKLFLSFSQVDGSITRRFGGTGLGLSICKMLVEAMNGSITVDSEKDKGSTFSFSVRLGLPEEHNEDSAKLENNFAWGMIHRGKEEKDEKWPPVMNYIGMLLNESSLLPQAVKGMDTSIYYEGQSTSSEHTQNMTASIEKLMICIEMESWEKAEEIATYIKRLIPKENQILNNKALHLLLTVRKEDHDTCIAELKGFEELIKQEKEY